MNRTGTAKLAYKVPNREIISVMDVFLYDELTPEDAIAHLQGSRTSVTVQETPYFHQGDPVAVPLVVFRHGGDIRHAAIKRGQAPEDAVSAAVAKLNGA